MISSVGASSNIPKHGKCIRMPIISIVTQKMTVHVGTPSLSLPNESSHLSIYLTSYQQCHHNHNDHHTIKRGEMKLDYLGKDL
jgi:hypothetical protein